MQEKILILDSGSQYTQLIARRVRELNVYCEIHPFNKVPEIDSSYKGVILSGSPFSVRDENAPKLELSQILLHLHTLDCTNGFLARINYHAAVLHICLMVAVMVPSLKSYVCINRALACLPEQSSETDRIILEKILVFLCLHKESSLHLKLCIMM